MNYTKGGWQAGSMDDEPFARSCKKVFSQTGELIAEVASIGFMPFEQVEANARLIAAAPDMYEAIQQVMCLDDMTPLESMAYSGGDVPKKWLREEAPKLQARSDARKEIKQILRKSLAKTEGDRE